MKLTNQNKIDIYQGLFMGRTDIYGSYNPKTGKTFQKKEPVTRAVIRNHLLGKTPYGIYLLNGKTTRQVVVDFDDHDANPPVTFICRAKHYSIPAYLEISKSKGYHVWIFFDPKGVLASKARTVAYQILEEIDAPDTELFPKQEAITANLKFGNFINAPLFGKLVSQNKTVFIDPKSLKPIKDLWSFLKNVKFVTEETLDHLIEINDWPIIKSDFPSENPLSAINPQSSSYRQLLPCTKRMLCGVENNQRVTAFRLAVHLKNFGFPYDTALAILNHWATCNKPANGKDVITRKEIISQLNYGYRPKYKSFGCGQSETIPFCSDKCPLYKKNMST